jgi:hypothetical protein
MQCLPEIPHILAVQQSPCTDFFHLQLSELSFVYPFPIRFNDNIIVTHLPVFFKCIGKISYPQYHSLKEYCIRQAYKSLKVLGFLILQGFFHA